MTPEHYFEPIFIIGVFFVMLSFLMHSIIRLRLVYIFGSLAFVAYGFLIKLWPMVFANSVLIGINTYELALLYLKSRNLLLPHILKHAFIPYETCLTSNEFYAITKNAEIKTLDRTQFIQQDKPIESLMLILKGEAIVKKNNKDIGMLTAGDFIGELALVTHTNMASAGVFCESSITLLIWNHHTLEQMKQKQLSDYRHLLDMININIATKLIRTSNPIKK